MSPESLRTLHNTLSPEEQEFLAQLGDSTMTFAEASQTNQLFTTRGLLQKGYLVLEDPPLERRDDPNTKVVISEKGKKFLEAESLKKAS